MRLIIFVGCISLSALAQEYNSHLIQKLSYNAYVKRKIKSIQEHMCKFPFNPLRNEATGQTLLHEALRYDKTGFLIEKLCTLFKNNNLDLSMPDKHGNTPLHYACLTGNVAAVSALLNHKADPNSKNAHGKCPIHMLVALRGKDEVEQNANRILSYLNRAGAQLNALDKNGFTPMHEAVFQENIPMQVLFKSYQLDFQTIKNNDNHTALDLWCILNNPETCIEYKKYVQRKTLTQLNSN